MKLEFLSPVSAAEFVAKVREASDLKELTCLGSPIGDEAAQAIPPGLQLLRLRNCNLHDVRQLPLAAATFVDLSFNSIDALPRLQAVETLHLVRTSISTPAVEMIAHGLSHLVELYLSDSAFNDDCARLLARSKLNKLRILDVTGNNLTAAGAKILSQCGLRLKSLGLSGNHIFIPDSERTFTDWDGNEGYLPAQNVPRDELQKLYGAKFSIF